MPAREESLLTLLHTTFGFSNFRAGQERVCRAVVAGSDVLLVMPTGAGKSLCYQLPTVARGGTAIVISPLIALMEDQAAKLAALGLRVARIHSGLDRSVARAACAEYLSDGLQFLFIAPERLRVPGFIEMLAKRQLSLIAIDEAHCISQWGHDFRPDYRMLGEHLPRLRGAGVAPVIALTATATPTVQADILEQLGMKNPEQFIHGFRRDNLAIEVVELSMPQRAAVICNLLRDSSRRPAIVYATSRKQSEALAEALHRGAKLCAAAYHAGLDAETRERVQTAFQSGKLDVVVATIAFGMGIDKANIRSVIHAGLPGTLEGFYQEIGRAGRDGAPSRTFLMHSYADQRTHDFFMTRDYPPKATLMNIYGSLGEQPQSVDDLRARARMDVEEFDKALEKLEIHGGARMDFGGNVIAGATEWKRGYTQQAQHRSEQLEKVLRFATSQECRMATLVRHFGDKDDAARTCGKCDLCDPAGAVLKKFRTVSSKERAIAADILKELRAVSYKAAGTLQRALDSGEHMSRNEFSALLDAMARVGLVEIEDAEYEKDGEVKRFRKVRSTEAGEHFHAAESAELLIADGVADEFEATDTRSNRTRKIASASKPTKTAKAETPEPMNAEDETLAAQLREWRTAESKRLGVPPFLILHDQTLNSIAKAKPRTPRQLLAVKGMGEVKLEKFGEAILKFFT
jgi:RecQ family ATP-dependent DNA helicase